MTTTGTARVTLPSDAEILITREFDAPRHLVWKAWTTPELVMRWWSGRRGAMTLVEIDLRVGGAWRYVMEAHNGTELAFHGTYSEIVPEARIVSTEAFEGMPDGEPAVNIITFAEHDDGRTTLELLIRMTGRADRDMLLQTGMETGMQEQMDLLEELAQSLRAR